MKSFASDNHSGAHVKVMEALKNANVEHAVAYGEDEITYAAVEKIKEHLGEDIDVYFVFNGTGSNILSLATIMQSYQAVICPASAHIYVDECGAIEHAVGCQLIAVDTADGKLRVEDIKPHLHVLGEMHHAQPKVISISQCTELGTLYQPEEVKALADFAHENNMLLHMDGARIFNAAAALQKTVKEITADLGVDVLSLGGTKNGMMFGEAVVFFNKDLSKGAKYVRKQYGLMSSKMRYIAAQFLEVLTDDLAYKNAEHSNRMAKRLYDGIKDIEGITPVQKVECNGLFIKLPAEVIPVLQERFFFYVWDYEESTVRWMTSFDTEEEDVNAFVSYIREVMENRKK